MDFGEAVVDSAYFNFVVAVPDRTLCSAFAGHRVDAMAGGHGCAVGWVSHWWGAGSSAWMYSSGEKGIRSVARSPVPT